jgi:hypothetical protein
MTAMNTKPRFKSVSGSAAVALRATAVTRAVIGRTGSTKATSGGHRLIPRRAETAVQEMRAVWGTVPAPGQDSGSDSTRPSPPRLDDESLVILLTCHSGSQSVYSSLKERAGVKSG